MNQLAEAVQRAHYLGATAAAAFAWREILSSTHVDETDYSDWCRELATLYAQTGRRQAAARV